MWQQLTARKHPIDVMALREDPVLGWRAPEKSWRRSEAPERGPRRWPEEGAVVANTWSPTVRHAQDLEW